MITDSPENIGIDPADTLYDAIVVDESKTGQLPGEEKPVDIL